MFLLSVPDIHQAMPEKSNPVGLNLLPVVALVLSPGTESTAWLSELSRCHSGTPYSAIGQ